MAAAHSFQGYFEICVIRSLTVRLGNQTSTRWLTLAQPTACLESIRRSRAADPNRGNDGSRTLQIRLHTSLESGCDRNSRRQSDGPGNRAFRLTGDLALA